MKASYEDLKDVSRKNTENYYKLLGLRPNCTQDTIREMYRRLAVAFHPDRNQGSESATFSKITHAYSVLSDPNTRAIYDIQMGFVDDGDSHARLIDMNKRKRKEAEQFIANSKQTLEKCIAEEKTKNGLIILEALYGDLFIEGDDSYNIPSAGRTLDVTAPLQVQIKDSSFFQHGGVTLALGEGFYDPNDFSVDNRLYVRYWFDGRLHEAIFDDLEPICLPLEEHIVTEEDWEEREASTTDDEEDDYDYYDDHEYYNTEEVEHRRQERLRQRRERAIERMRREAGVRAVPRLQKKREMDIVKASRRKKLYMVLAALGVATTWGLHAAGVIDITSWKSYEYVTKLYQSYFSPSTADVDRLPTESTSVASSSTQRSSKQDSTGTVSAPPSQSSVGSDFTVTIVDYDHDVSSLSSSSSSSPNTSQYAV